MQVEGMRNEYNRVTSSQNKADASAGRKLDSSADSSQLKQLQVMHGLPHLLHQRIIEVSCNLVSSVVYCTAVWSAYAIMLCGAFKSLQHDSQGSMLC